MARKLRKITGWLVLATVLLLVLIVVAPFTSVGSALIISVAERYLPLEVDHDSGALFGDLKLNRVRWQQDGLIFEAEALQLALDRGCLWRDALCLKWLRAESITLDIVEAEAASEQQPAAASAPVEFPLPISVDEIAVAHFNLNWPGGRWQHQQWRGGVAIKGSQVRLISQQMAEAQLHLAAGQETSSSGFQPSPIALPVELVVERLAIDQVEVFQDQQAVVAFSLATALDWRETALTLDNLALSSQQWGSHRITGKAEFTGNWPLTLALESQPPELDSQLNQVPLEPGETVAIELSGDLARLAVNARSERSALAVEGWLNVIDQQLPFELNLRAPDAAKLIVGWLPQLTDYQAQFALRGGLEVAVRGDIDRQQVQAELQALVQGEREFAVAVDASHAAGVVNVAQLQLTDPSRQQQLALSGTVDTNNILKGDLTFSTDDFAIDGLIPSATNAMTGSIAGSGRAAFNSGDCWSVEVNSLDLKGEVNRRPAVLTGNLTLGCDVLLRAANLQGEFNAARIALTPAGLEASGPRFQAKLIVDDLSLWQPGLRGKVNANLLLAPDATTVEVEAEATRIRWESLAAEAVQLTSRLSWRDLSQLTGQLTLTDASTPAGQFKTLGLALSEEGSDKRLELTLDGDITTQLSWRGQKKDNQWRGELAQATLQTVVGNWQMDKAIDLSLNSKTYAVSAGAHCWQHESGSICFDQLALGGSGALSARLQGDLYAVSPLLPETLALSGRLDGDLAARWGDNKPPVIEARLEGINIALTQQLGWDEVATLTWERLFVLAKPKSKGFTAQLELWRDGMAVVDGDLELQGNEANSLSGNVALNGFKLVSLQPLLPTFSRLEGVLLGDVAVAGTLTQPALSGRLQLQEGALALIANPNEVEQISMTLDLLGDRAQFDGSGTLGEGNVQLRGEVNLLPERTVELTLNGERNRLFVERGGEITASQNLQFNINPEGYRLTGDIVIHSGKIELDELPEGAVPVSRDVVVVNFENTEAEKTLSSSIRLKLDIAEQLRVVGSALDATLGGDLRIQQKPGQPVQMFGTLNVVGGELRAYGRGLQLKRGTLGFTGDAENPALALRAEREIKTDNVRVGVNVGGTLLMPKLDIFSSPPMSQTEALSYLVRGRGLDEGAGYDSNAMALSLGASAINESGLLTPVEKISGIRDLGLGAEGSADDTKATVSGYVGERLYFSYGVGLYQPIQELKTRFYINSRLWLEFASSLQNSADLYYSFEID